MNENTATFFFFFLFEVIEQIFLYGRNVDMKGKGTWYRCFLYPRSSSYIMTTILMPMSGTMQEPIRRSPFFLPCRMPFLFPEHTSH